MAKAPKAYEPEGFRMIVTVAALPLGGSTIARQDEVIFVNENTRKSLLCVGSAKDA